MSSLSLVRYRTNDYSVPVAYGYRDVIVRGYVDRVVISCGSEIIARHPAAPPAGMGKSIPSCQGEINRVSQPPPELRQGGFPSRGRKQGCFQPPWPGAVAWADVPDLAVMWHGRWYSSTMVAKYTRGESARWLE